MSERAMRLAKYLEEELGWTVYDEVKKCTCGNTEYFREKRYCSKCGKNLPLARPRKDTIEQLERAIEFAIKKKRTK